MGWECGLHWRDCRPSSAALFSTPFRDILSDAPSRSHSYRAPRVFAAQPGRELCFHLRPSEPEERCAELTRHRPNLHDPVDVIGMLGRIKNDHHPQVREANQVWLVGAEEPANSFQVLYVVLNGDL